jgi:hypothetical protein
LAARAGQVILLGADIDACCFEAVLPGPPPAPSFNANTGLSKSFPATVDFGKVSHLHILRGGPCSGLWEYRKRCKIGVVAAARCCFADVDVSY